MTLLCCGTLFYFLGEVELSAVSMEEVRCSSSTIESFVVDEGNAACIVRLWQSRSNGLSEMKIGVGFICFWFLLLALGIMSHRTGDGRHWKLHFNVHYG